MSSRSHVRLRRVATWSGRAPRIPRELLLFGWISVALQLALATFLTTQWLRGRTTAAPAILVALCLVSALRDLRPLWRGRGRSRGVYTTFRWLAMGLGTVYLLGVSASIVGELRGSRTLDTGGLCALAIAFASVALGLWLSRALRRPDVQTYFTHFERRELRRRRLARRLSALVPASA